MNNNKLKITFLGGVGEIGKNMTAFEYNDEIIIVDAGMAFPGNDMPGIDVIIPDITYLTKNKDKVKAILLTHGHEDHIGALPYVLADLHCPIYGTKLTLALVDNKMREHPRVKYKAVTVKPRNVLKIGAFTVEFISVAHSIGGSMAMCINTPVGRIIHTGDFKIDYEVSEGNRTDLQRLGELGRNGVKLLMCESTNVCRAGYALSEKDVARTLDSIFQTHPTNRLFITSFASNTHRLQAILQLAEKYKRKVAFFGRSMVNTVEAASKIGEIVYNKDVVIDPDKIEKYADNELVIFTTGSQGQPETALARFANGDNKSKVKIGENDVVIFSSSPVPGNEKSVNTLINNIFKTGADVIYDELADVHASGHACQEELKILHSLVKPEFFVPIHGEYRHLRMHKKLAMRMGTEERNILLPTIGAQFELSQNSLRQARVVPSGQRLVDGYGIGDLESSTLKDRKQLSEDGICIAVVNINNVDGSIAKDPFIITRGVVYQDESEAFVQDARSAVVASLKEQDLRGTEPSAIRNTIKKNLSNFIFKRTKRKPIVIAIVLLD